MESNVETYIMLLKHEMAAEDLKSVDLKFIEKIILDADGNLDDLESVLNHPSLRKNQDEEYYVS